MDKKKNTEKKIKMSNRVVYIISLLLIGLSIGSIVVFAINTTSTGYKVEDYVYDKLIIPDKNPYTSHYCAWVDNNNCPGTAIFIPTKTRSEWNSFRAYYPSCSDICQDSNAYLNQPSYFPVSVCGSFDYNCDGVETQKDTEFQFSYYNQNQCGYCQIGWDYWADAIPECGEYEFWYTGDCDGIFCEFLYRRQECH